MNTVGGELVKSTWVTRRFAPDLPIVWRPLGEATAGDVLLCEVVRLGLHGRVETTSGSRRKLYAGDRIVCVLANRYATSLLEAVALVDGDHADMISASGLCGRVVARAQKASNPTVLRIVGQAFLGDKSLNMRSLPIAIPAPALGEPNWIVVVGSAMDSGKTTACAAIIRGLVEAGHSVGAVKVTGTASGRDFGSYVDAGASPVLDFLDAGFASTAGCSAREISEITDHLAAHVRAAGVEWGVVEIADGLLQPETRMLLDVIGRLLPQPEIVITARESLAAVAAVERMRPLGLNVAAVSGLLTNSPLVRREAELAAGVSAVPTHDLGRWFAKRAARTARTAPSEAGRAVESLDTASP